MKEVRFTMNTDRSRTDTPVPEPLSGFLVTVAAVAVLAAIMVISAHRLALVIALVAVAGYGLSRLVARRRPPTIPMPGTGTRLHISTTRNCVTEEGSVSRALTVALVQRDRR